MISIGVPAGATIEYSCLISKPGTPLSLIVGISGAKEERLGDDRRAIEAYKEVLIADARNANTLDALERLYGKTGQLEAQMDIVEQKLEVADVGADRIRLLQPVSYTHLTLPTNREV